MMGYTAPSLDAVCDAMAQAPLCAIDADQKDAAVLFIRYINYGSDGVLFLWMTLQHGVIKQFQTLHEPEILCGPTEAATPIAQFIINTIKSEPPDSQKESFEEVGVHPIDPATFWDMAMAGRDPAEAAYFLHLPKLSKSDRIKVPAIVFEKVCHR